MIAVLRFSNVSVSRDVLETALEERVSRFERNRSDDMHYAQVDLPEVVDFWPTIRSFLARIGPRMSRLIKTGALSGATVDVAVTFDARLGSTSVVIPSSVVHLLGENNIELEVSIYLTAAEQGSE